jgi:hypothetical protein
MSEAQNCMSMKPIRPVLPRQLEDEELVARSRTGDVYAGGGPARLGSNF